MLERSTSSAGCIQSVLPNAFIYTVYIQRSPQSADLVHSLFLNPQNLKLLYTVRSSTFLCVDCTLYNMPAHKKKRSVPNQTNIHLLMHIF